MRTINSIEPEAFEFQPELGQFEGAFGEFESDLEADTGEFEGAFGEFEAPAAQKNWYYFDAWWRPTSGSQKKLAKYGPRQETEADGSRLFDAFCLTHQNNSSSQGAGKLLVRCYQWLPASSRWVACKSVVGFKRGMCTSDKSELEFERGSLEEFEAPGNAPAPRRYVRDFSGPAAECTNALRRAGKTKAEALTIINTQIRVAIAMLRKAANDLKRGSRSAKTRALFLKIFRVRPEFVPTWLKPTAEIKDRGDVVAVRCKRVADLLASGTLRFFCTINSTNCPDCGDDPSGFGCSSWGAHKVVCLGNDFWDAMKAGDTTSVLATVMHEPFHVYFGRYVTAHVASRGKFGGIDCIVQFVFETNNRTPPALELQGCTDAVVRNELGSFG